MPKGFLVKRTKRTGPVSYRIRQDDSLQQDYSLHVSASHVYHYNAQSQKTATVQPLVCNGQLENIQSSKRFRGIPGESCLTSTNTARPANSERMQKYSLGTWRKLNSGSPFKQEYFPEAQTNGQKCVVPPFSKSLTDLNVKLGLMNSKPASPAFAQHITPKSRLKQVHPKKQRLSIVTPSEKRLDNRERMTTSAVHGPRIKYPEEEVKQRPVTSNPLGEFICQLCKERYSDPLTLAQHQCSRIVPIVYRCTECEKVFSCPANLASHRRWHKPKSDQGTMGDRLKPSLLQVNKHINILDASYPKPSDLRYEGGITFDCTVCCKKFSRQSYLRKHLALHSRKAVNLQQNRQHTEENMDKPFNDLLRHNSHVSPSPSNPTRTASVTDSSETYLCKFCGDIFFSSPGLTRHINKCRPKEAEEVVFIPQRV